MAENPVTTNSGGGDELLAKLNKLEANLQEIEKAKRQQTIVVRVGLLLVLLAIFVFAWNLYSFALQFASQDNLGKLQDKILSDMNDLIANNPDIKGIQKDLTDKIIPDMTKQVVKKFKDDLPSFEKKGTVILDNLQIHLENHVKSELEKALESSVNDAGKEIQKTFPKLTPEKLELAMKAAENQFVEEVASMLEKRIDMVADEFEKMDKTLGKFGKLEEAKGLEKKEMDEIKLELLESVLELAIYEINPERGNKPAVAAAKGGAK